MSGAAGFVGSAVMRRLAREPTVRAVGLARAAVQKESWILGSLGALTRRDWEKHGITALDALVHLAAFTPKHAADRDRVAEVVSSNVLGLQALLESLPTAPRRIVFCSTLDVYAPHAFAGVLDERSAVAPDGLYGASKLFGEALVHAHARAAGSECVVLRLGHLYGPGEERYAKLIPESIRRLLAGQRPVLSGDGAELRDLLHVDDAAEAIVRATSAPLRGVELINVARGESVAVRDVVGLICREFGAGGPEAAGLGQRVARSIRFDTTLMRRILGEWPMTPLADGLRQEIAWFRSRQ